LTVYRVPTWINYQYNITGLLYWSTVTTVIDPWGNPAFSHSARHFNGGGFLFYPGVPCGIDGPVSSMRLKNLRDGMEDYEYFAILERLAPLEVHTEDMTILGGDFFLTGLAGKEGHSAELPSGLSLRVEDSRSPVKKIVNIIAPNWWNFSKDPDKFLAAREKIAEQILRLKYGEGFPKRERLRLGAPDKS